MYGGSIAFGVDDVAAGRATLEDAGVEFHGDTFDSGVCHGAVFVGNPLQLHHRYAPRSTGSLRPMSSSAPISSECLSPTGRKEEFYAAGSA